MRATTIIEGNRFSWISSTLWFILIAVLWTGYLVLDGFDLGAGHAAEGWAKTNLSAVLLNTIGPV